MNSMMGIDSPTGSHLPVLESCVAELPTDALVMEHGAGLYSTVLLARRGVKVVCAEPHPGWAEWARWTYDGRGEVVDSFKRLVPRLTEAALVFIDGPAKERGPLLNLCIERRVPIIICHDTNEDHCREYGYHSHYFTAPGYTVTHSAEDTHRTTLWKLSR